MSSVILSSSIIKHQLRWRFIFSTNPTIRRIRVSGEEGFLWFHTAAPKVGPHVRACAHTRPRHRRGVGERPHVRWSVERTASLAVAKPRCSGGQTRWTCELSCLFKVYNPKRWPAEGAVLFRPIMWLYSASVVLVWDSFLPFTLLWPYSSKVHLVLATAQKLNKEYYMLTQYFRGFTVVRKRQE